MDVEEFRKKRLDVGAGREKPMREALHRLDQRGGLVGRETQDSLAFVWKAEEHPVKKKPLGISDKMMEVLRLCDKQLTGHQLV